MTQAEYYSRMSVLAKECARQYIWQGAECLAEIQMEQHQAMETELASLSTQDRNKPAQQNQISDLNQKEAQYLRIVRESAGETDLKTMNVWDHPNDLSYEYHKMITGQNRTKGGD